MDPLRPHRSISTDSASFHQKTGGIANAGPASEGDRHDVPGPFEVVREESRASREAMGKTYDRVVAVLRKVKKE